MKKLKWVVGSSLVLALAASISINCMQHKSSRSFETQLWDKYHKISCGYFRVVSRLPDSTTESKEFTYAMHSLSEDIKGLNDVLAEYSK